jgi:ribosomal protein S21
MRRYNQNDRNYGREYGQGVQEDYRDRERENTYPHEPKDRGPGALARVRVELKRKYNDPDRNFKEMLQEFRRRVSNAGIMHDFKDHQFYMSEGERARKTKRDTVKRMLMDSLTKKIVAGERIEGHGGMVKKIMSNLKKEKEKKEKRKERQNKYHQDGGYRPRYRDDQ